MLKKITLIVLLPLISYSNNTYIVDNIFAQKDEYKVMEKSLKKLNLSNKQKIEIRKVRYSNSKNNYKYKKSNIKGYTIDNDGVNNNIYLKRQNERIIKESKRKLIIMNRVFSILSKDQRVKLVNEMKKKLYREKRTTKKKISYDY